MKNKKFFIFKTNRKNYCLNSLSFLLFFIVCKPLFLSAQITFEKYWYTSGIGHVGRFVQQTTDGGYFLVGTWENNYPQDNKSTIYWAKTDQYGNLVWSNKIGNDFIDNFEAESGSLTSDGGYVIAGCINCYKNPPDPISKYLLIKIGSGGDTIWTKTYERDKRSWAMWVEETYDKGFILTGYGASSNGSADIWIVKTDSVGNLIWDKPYNNGEDRGWCVRQTNDSGYIVVGSTGVGSNSKVWLLKLHNSGDTAWTKIYPGGNWGYYGGRAYEIDETDDSGYIMCGAMSNLFNLTKFDYLGSVVWSKKLDMAIASVVQTSDGGYAIAGNIYVFNPRGDIGLVKTDSAGDILWQRNFNSGWHVEYDTTGNDTILDNTDLGRFVRQCSDGGYIVTGFETQHLYTYLIKTDSNGQLTWVNEVPFSEKTGLQVYPNPTKNQTTLNFRLPSSEKVYISVYDIAGKEKLCLFEDFVEKNMDYSINFKTDELDAGIYLLEMNTGDKKYYDKLVLVK